MVLRVKGLWFMVQSACGLDGLSKNVNIRTFMHMYIHSHSGMCMHACICAYTLCHMRIHACVCAFVLMLTSKHQPQRDNGPRPPSFRRSDSDHELYVTM
jgi:hypothetical protein